MTAFYLADAVLGSGIDGADEHLVVLAQVQVREELLEVDALFHLELLRELFDPVLVGQVLDEKLQDVVVHLEAGPDLTEKLWA